ncbi:hypothetical protein F4778DRAFT_715359 [Xylariomycetidae sp. FL2044]|nr:hypothetical protein F4778DRAFT_715359 [Xylariomycetidae sp. FL2044]
MRSKENPLALCIWAFFLISPSLAFELGWHTYRRRGRGKHKIHACVICTVYAFSWFSSLFPSSSPVLALFRFF